MTIRSTTTALAALALMAGCATTGTPTRSVLPDSTVSSAPAMPALLTLAQADKNDAVAPEAVMSGKQGQPRPAQLAQIGNDLSVAPSSGLSNRSIVKHLPNSTAAKILRSLGFSIRKLKPGVFRFKLGRFVVLFFNKGRNCQLYAGFRNKPGLAVVNKWNKGKRFSRAYLDNTRDAVIESDLDFDGGTTIGAIKEFIRTFKLSVTAYAKHINRRP